MNQRLLGELSVYQALRDVMASDQRELLVPGEAANIAYKILNPMTRAGIPNSVEAE